MKNTVLSGLVTSSLVLLAACSQTPPLELTPAASNESFRISARGAEAHFESREDCLVTYTAISASESKTKLSQGPGTIGSQAYISFGSYNECTYEGGIDLRGYTSDAHFSIDKRLKTARLTATFEVETCGFDDDEDYTCEPVGPAEVTISWTGDGDLIRGRDTSQWQTPSFKYTERFQGLSRDAIANGMISFGGETSELAATSEASLFSGKYSVRIVNKGM